MLRYCAKCKKEFDYPPRAITAAAPLICPECGSEIPKESRRPDHGLEADRSEEKIGKAASVIFHMIYIFYISMALIGSIGYVTGFHALLYVTAGISLAVYTVQAIAHVTAFPTGVVFIPLGAIAGYLIFKGLPGVCLGIHIVFAVRHILRDIVFRFIFWVIGKSQQ